MKTEGCPECERLWRQYAEATKRCDEVKRRQDVAAELNHMEEFLALERAIEAAGEEQNQAWLDLERHETWSHHARV